MGFFGSLFQAIFTPIGKLNADPVQQQLAQLLIQAAEGPLGGVVIRSFVLKQNWEPFEEQRRIAHAVSMVRVWRPDLYAEVNKIAKEHIAWSSAD